jgi:nucleoid-associated protein YgaU
VQPDENLWSIAHDTQDQALGRAPTEAETASYWATLLEANRPRLSDPDLVQPGQTLHLPAPLARS